jgi:hypothetical protein
LLGRSRASRGICACPHSGMPRLTLTLGHRLGDSPAPAD